MEKFRELKKMGDGSFGIVTKAINIQTNELVAIKKMKQKYSSWEECMNLRELKALQKLKHTNIVKLKEVIRQNDELSFVFEFLDCNVYQLYTKYKEQGKYMPENEIKSFIYQCASALAYMHKHGFFHRDLKPENILVNQQGILKIIDFGLAREIRSRPPYTDYVATRWYRAPEILLKQNNYNSPVDIFALGCIMCELYLNRPMFSGNSEMDQLNKILSTLGTFQQSDWTEGHRLVAQKGMTLAQFAPVPLSQILTNASTDAINLISQMLRWDPNKRITAIQMLQHPYFNNPQIFLPIEINDQQKSHSVQPDQHNTTNHMKETLVFPPPLPNSRQRQRQHGNDGFSLNMNTDDGYLPSFAQQQNQQSFKQQRIPFLQSNLKEISNEIPNRIPSSDKRRRADSNGGDNSYYKNPAEREIDEMLDLINFTTNDHKDQKQTQQQDLGSYQPSSFTKSQNKIRNSIHDEYGNDYGSYVPSTIAKKSNFNQGLQLPPQQQNKQSYANSIYNFDNFAFKPEQRKPVGGLQLPKQF